jgi:hypothetical protein
MAEKTKLFVVFYEDEFVSNFFLPVTPTLTFPTIAQSLFFEQKSLTKGRKTFFWPDN